MKTFFFQGFLSEESVIKIRTRIKKKKGKEWRKKLHMVCTWCACVQLRGRESIAADWCLASLYVCTTIGPTK